MNKFFKVSLVAAAVAMSGSALAGELTATATDYAKEGLDVANKTANNNVAAVTSVYKVKTAYPVGASVTLTFPANSIAAGYVFPATMSGTDQDAGPAAPLAGILDTPVRLSNDSVKYNVAKALTTDDTIDLVLPTAGAVKPLLGTAVAAAPVTLTVTANYASGAALDTTAKNAAELTKVKSQYGKLALKTGTTGLTKKIDVSEARMEFTSGTDVTAEFTWDAVAKTLDSAIENLTIVATLDADLSGFEVDKDGFVTGVVGKFMTAAVATTPTVLAKYDATTKQVTFSHTVLTGSDVIDDFTGMTIEITPPVTDATAKTEAVELMVQNFNANVEYTYNTTDKASIGPASAGSWTLNGSSGMIEYMPFGNTISQIIYVTNKGDVEGAITGDAIVNGEKIDLGDLGTATAKTVTPIAGKIKAALEEAGITGSAKARLNIVVNSPSSDIKIYASYNVGGSDRGFVPVTHTN